MSVKRWAAEVIRLRIKTPPEPRAATLLCPWLTAWRRIEVREDPVQLADPAGEGTRVDDDLGHASQPPRLLLNVGREVRDASSQRPMHTAKMPSPTTNAR
eukprot:9056244-Pyramimonas_sp.AAC.1